MENLIPNYFDGKSDAYKNIQEMIDFLIRHQNSKKGIEALKDLNEYLKSLTEINEKYINSVHKKVVE